MPHEYDRLPNETDKAWRAFSLFLDLGNTRELSKVAKKLSISIQSVFRWSKKYNWNERAVAYDNDLKSAVRDATVEQEIDIVKSFYEVAALELQAQKNELIIKITEQNRKIANPDYEYRPASLRTISESGKLTVDKHLLLSPQKPGMGQDKEPALETFVKSLSESD